MGLGSDKASEKCGVVGIFGDPKASCLCYQALHILLHRGQEGAGIVTVHNNLLKSITNSSPKLYKCILAISAVPQEARFLASAITCITVKGLLIVEVNVNTMRELGSGGVSLVSMTMRALGNVGVQIAWFVISSIYNDIMTMIDEHLILLSSTGES